MATLGSLILLQVTLAGTCPGSRPPPSFWDSFTINPAQILVALVGVFLVLPIVACFLAMTEPPIDTFGRWVLLFTWVSYGLAILALLARSVEPPPPGSHNGVLVFFAVVLAAMDLFWFRMWLAARRHAWKRTLPPGRRRYEDLVDVNEALESARSGLAHAQRSLQGFFLNHRDRHQLKLDIAIYEATIATLEKKRAALEAGEIV